MTSPSDTLFEWLLAGAPGASTSTDVVERLGTGFGVAGVPADQVSVFVTTLHPTILGRRFRWRKGDAEVSTFELTAGIQNSEVFTRSPVFNVTTQRTPYRRRLSEPIAADDLPVLLDLKNDGYTDYVCEPLLFTNGETHAISVATRAPAGFTDAHIDHIRRVILPLTRLAEIFALRRVATNLLSTYVGRNCGERILAGRIMKGDVESLRAIIWFSDLRGFTELSSRSSPQHIIETLNELFECQVPAIEKRGGEVLKFMGDGLLAIFPLDAAIGPRCTDALAAAEDAFAALALRNARSPQPINFGLALHVGDVAYGNIGGASRLDFTAIGPAVNIASRLEGLTGKLGRTILLSSELAHHADTPLVDLGEHDLKGVPTKQRVYGLARGGLSTTRRVP